MRNKKQFFNTKRSQLETTFWIQHCDGQETEVRIRYKSKAEEIFLPRFDEAPCYLFLSTFALWFEDSNGEFHVEIPTRNSLWCSNPIDYVQHNLIFPIDEDVVKAYNPSDPSLESLDGELIALSDFDEEPGEHIEYETTSSLITFYINYFKENGVENIPHSSVYYKNNVSDLSRALKKLEIS